MTEYSDMVEEARLKQKAERWGKQVTSIQANNGIIETRFKNGDVHYEENKEGWVNINPLKKHYTTCDPNGTDYKVDIKNIPLFWKDKISEIDINPDFDSSQVRSAEARRILEMVSHAEPFLRLSLINKIMKQYGYQK